MRFQANPDSTILPQNDIELLCEARGSLTTACRTILRSEIKVNSVHRVFRANFFAIVHRGFKKKFGSREQGVTATAPKTPLWIRTCPLVISLKKSGIQFEFQQKQTKNKEIRAKNHKPHHLSQHYSEVWSPQNEYQQSQRFMTNKGGHP
jgi:hypothetical protein